MVTVMNVDQLIFHKLPEKDDGIGVIAFQTPVLAVGDVIDANLPIAKFLSSTTIGWEIFKGTTWNRSGGALYNYVDRKGQGDDGTWLILGPQIANSNSSNMALNDWPKYNAAPANKPLVVNRYLSLNVRSDAVKSPGGGIVQYTISYKRLIPESGLIGGIDLFSWLRGG